MCQSIGGVTEKHAIKFYVQLAFGEKANAVINANVTFDDLVELCLRKSWGPAFSHVSENTYGFQQLNDKDQEKEIQNCIEKLYPMYNDYFKRDDKSTYLNNNLQGFECAISRVKELKSIEHPIGLGHFQKLFNMTTKYLLALYVLRKSIWNNNNDPFKPFIGKIEGCFANADCPIDSKILENLYNNKKYKGKAWSQFDDIKDYREVQLEIQKRVNNKSNLCYDFENW